MSNSALNGLHTAIITPFDRHGDLKLECVASLLEYQRRAGIDGVVVCGTNGEGTSLSIQERKNLLETMLEHRGSLKVIAGTGAGNLPETLELTRHAAESGADAALVLPPFFLKKITDEGLANWFRSVLDSADLPILLYNIPQMTSIPITDGVLERLEGHPKLAGLKDSTGDWNSFSHYAKTYPQLQLFCGSDLIAGQAWSLGAAGSISGTANSFPELCYAVRNAFRTGNNVQEAQDRLTSVCRILLKYPFISNNKTVIASRGLPETFVRSPLADMTQEQTFTMLEELRASGLFAP